MFTAIPMCACAKQLKNALPVCWPAIITGHQLPAIGAGQSIVIAETLLKNYLNQMKSFSDLNVKSKTLTGEKITMAEILDKPITVLDYRIEDSKYGKRANPKCLY